MKTINNLICPAFALFAFACFAFAPQARATCQDACLPGFNTVQGDDGFNLLTTGAANTGLGWRALFSVGAGNNNTAVGTGALVLDTADSNTAVGTAALLLNTTGTQNTATGTAALEFNDIGINNTATGAFALTNNTVDGNTATGAFALEANTTGGTVENVLGTVDLGPNTAIGSHALENNVDGSANTAVGFQALHSQTGGLFFLGLPQFAANTAVGFEALGNVTGVTTGFNFWNVALGYQALNDLTDGADNIAIGAQAGSGLTTGSGNVFIGTQIGPATDGESSHTYIANIDSTTVTDDPVYVDLSTGLLGHFSSSRRYKEDVKPMNNASEALYRLQPVTYRYNKDVDRTQRLDYGLIAEDVAKVDPSLAVRDGKGQIESVRYTAINAMLLNEFLKEHKKVENLQATVVQQQKGIELLSAQLKEQAAQIQKVSAQLEMSRPAAKVVVNKP